MKLTHKSGKGDTRSSPFDKEPESPRKRLSPKTLATIKGGTKENPIKMDAQPKIMSKKKQMMGKKAVEEVRIDEPGSRMRTESRGLSQNVTGSRPDLFGKGNRPDQPINLIERDHSHEDLLNSGNSKRRQIVGLAPTSSNMNSSLHAIGSREEIERQALTAKIQSDVKINGISDEVQKNLLNFDHNIRSHEHSEAALLDNPGTLSNLHRKMHIDAEKELSNLINGGNLPMTDSQAAMKNPYITSVAKA